jgi:hypothetical protein
MLRSRSPASLAKLIGCMPKVLILCSDKRDEVRDVARFLERVCGTNWRLSDGAVLVPVAENHLLDRRRCHDLAQAAQQLYGSAYGGNESPQVAAIFPESSPPHFRNWPSLPDLEVMPWSVLQSEANSRLARLLSRANVDWLSQRAREFERWEHGEPGEAVDMRRIRNWLDQFERFSPGYQFVGEGLLRAYSLMSPQELMHALDLLEIEANTLLAVAIDPRSLGKSGARLSTLLRKKFAISVLPLTDAIENAAPGQTVLWIEDGLWGNIEFKGVIESLLGERPHDRLKSRPLMDPNQLRKVQIRARFACATDLGLRSATLELERRGLPNISIDNTVVTHPVLTPHGHSALQTSQFLTTGKYPVCSDPANFMSSPLVRFIANPWKDGGQASRAIETCRLIGEQLWVNYLQAKSWLEPGDPRPGAWALGANGIFSMTGFAHSIPKAASPVFWASGLVMGKGKPFIWQPLFSQAN